MDRGDVPVRAGAGHLQSFTGDHQRLTGQRGPDRLDRGVWQRGQVGQGLVLDRCAVTVGAAPQVADVLAWLTGLVDAPIRESGGRRESHPPAPTEPCVTVSRHTALTTLPA